LRYIIKMVNYAEGKIYKIIAKETDKVYYGSTCNSLKRRLKGHLDELKRGTTITSKEILQYENYEIILVENFACVNKKELLDRENYWIKNNECVNKIMFNFNEDFSKGKIYKIVSPSHPELVYYGSTIGKLNTRLYKHKLHECSSKLITCYNDAKIELIENWPCENRQELEKRERYYIDTFECVNINVPGRTQAERKKKYDDTHKEKLQNYRNENKKRKVDYDKKRRNENKEKIQERRKLTFVCECGSTSTTDHKSRHIRSKIHQDFINNNLN
jgi:hypothetical protein